MEVGTKTPQHSPSVLSSVAAMSKNQLDPSVQNEVAAILYSLKRGVVQR